ncbi:hypothetical protein GGF31_006239 [Allomyces arbusculus]|nr:hypothetical protein GGF31_006239 [Allomyces arbusculus]
MGDNSDIRLRHIQSLFASLPATRTTPNPNEYEIPLALASPASSHLSTGTGGTSGGNGTGSSSTGTAGAAVWGLILTVILPPAFPAVAPDLTLSPPCVHPMVEGNVLLWERAGGRDPWSPTRSWLGPYVAQVVQELTARPPVKLSGHAATLQPRATPRPTSIASPQQRSASIDAGMLTTPPTRPTSMFATPSPLSTATTPLRRGRLPPPSSDSIPIDEWRLPDSEPDLAFLNRHDEALDVHFAASVPRVRHMLDVRADLIKANAQVASQVVEVGKSRAVPQLARARALQASVADARDAWMKLNDRHAALANGKYALPALLGEVRAAADAADAESDRILAKWDGEAEGVVKAYRAARKRYHVLMARLEVVEQAGTAVVGPPSPVAAAGGGGGGMWR